LKGGHLSPTSIRNGQIVALPRNHWFSGNNLGGDVGLESLDHFLPPPLHPVIALHVGTHHAVFLGVRTRTLGLGCFDQLRETECYNSTCTYLLGVLSCFYGQLRRKWGRVYSIHGFFKSKISLAPDYTH